MGQYDRNQVTVDHVMPKTQGGILSKKNKVYACNGCNSLKADLTIEEMVKLIDILQRLNHSNYQKQKAYLRKVKKSCINLIKIKR